jgi:hypothetical protein
VDATAAFDGDPLTAWDGCCSNYPQQAISFALDSVDGAVTGYEFSTQSGECPGAWILEASDSDTGPWETIDSQSEQGCHDNVYVTYRIAVPTIKQYWRWSFIQGIGGNDNGIQLREIKLLGGCDPVSTGNYPAFAIPGREVFNYPSHSGHTASVCFDDAAAAGAGTGGCDTWCTLDRAVTGSVGCGDNLNKLCNTQFEIMSETTTSCESPVVRIDIPNWHPNSPGAGGGWGNAGGLTFEGDGCEAVVRASDSTDNNIGIVTPRVHTDYQGQNTCGGENVCAGPGGSTNGDGRELLLTETDGTNAGGVAY